MATITTLQNSQDPSVRLAGSQADGRHMKDNMDLLSREGLDRNKTKLEASVNHTKPPFTQRSMIPRAKGSNSRLREASREQATPEKLSHIAFLQKSEQEVHKSSTDGTNDTEPSSPYTMRPKGIPIPHPSTPRKGEDADSKWIYREKLIQIEKEELQQLETKLDSLNEEEIHRESVAFVNINVGDYNGTPTSSREQHSDLSGSQVLDVTDNNTPQVTPFKESDTRVGSRAGMSRIPIASNSPLVPTPSPGTVTPLQGRQGPVRLIPNPGGAIKYTKPRARAVSDVATSPITPNVWSQNTPNAQSPRSPISSSTPITGDFSSASKARPQSRGASGTQSREVSVARKTSSSTYKQRRPLSSSGPRNPVNRLEGEAPWIADMYKPDPMLPQDQQIVPTHAKRLGLHLIKRDVSNPVAPKDFISTLEDQGDATVDNALKQESAEVLYEAGNEQVDEDYDEVRRRENGPSFLAWKTPTTRNRDAMIIESAERSSDGTNVTARKDDSNHTEGQDIPITIGTRGSPNQQADHTQDYRSLSKPPATAVPNTCPAAERSTGPHSSTEPPHGGYKVMPTVRTTVEMQKAIPLPPALRGTTPQPEPSQQSFKGRYPTLVRPQGERQVPREKSSVVNSPKPPDATLQQQPVTSKPIRAMNTEEPAIAKERNGCGGCCAVM